MSAKTAKCEKLSTEAVKAQPMLAISRTAQQAKSSQRRRSQTRSRSSPARLSKESACQAHAQHRTGGRARGRCRARARRAPETL
eukprot:1882187-Alexandrium_andersonii.AAC.1